MHEMAKWTLLEPSDRCVGAHDKPDGWKMISWGWSLPKRHHSNHKRRAELAGEKLYYSLKTMARKFRKYGQLGNIAIHLQNMPILNQSTEERNARV